MITRAQVEALCVLVIFWSAWTITANPWTALAVTCVLVITVDWWAKR